VSAGVNSQQTLTVLCNVGDVATGGGYYLPTLAGIRVINDLPTAGATGWSVRIAVDSPPATDYLWAVSVVCADMP
jgi:hypothetical protein